MKSHVLDLIFTLHASDSFKTFLGAPRDTPCTRFIAGFVDVVASGFSGKVMVH